MKKLVLAFALVIGVMGLTACEESGPQKELRLFKESCKKNPDAQPCKDYAAQNSGT